MSTEPPDLDHFDLDDAWRLGTTGSPTHSEETDVRES